MANALKRIEVAAARIEVAAGAGGVAQDEGLAQAHARLKAETREALAELDAVIGALEP